jgi:hypothetical protein
MQPLAVGVTVSVAIVVVAPVLLPMNDPIFPVPEVARPIEELLFLHV